MFFFLSEFEVYLKSKIIDIHPIPIDEKLSCSSEPTDMPSSSFPSMSKQYNPLDAYSARKSLTNDSKVSVYFTPQDSVDQPQLQISPMHINYIRENLDSYIGCLKPAVSDLKFDFDMHRLQTDLEKEVDRRRKRYRMNSDEFESVGDEYDTEKTKMLNNTDSMDEMNIGPGYIRMNTLPRRNKFKKNGGSKDLYYSLENVFDSNAANNYQMHTSTKTIDEASETQLTSSASDNCSSNETSHPNQLNCSHQGASNIVNNPSQSVLVLNNVTLGGFNDAPISSSMPNISEPTTTKDGVIEVNTENNQILK